MGPCASSIFVRNCENSKLVIICQQLRLRDCKNLHIMLFSQTEPIIEASSNITFSSFQGYSYPELLQQMKLAKLSPWNNKWSEVFDFSAKQDEEHFALNNNIFLRDEFTPAFETLRTQFDNLNQGR